MPKIDKIKLKKELDIIFRIINKITIEIRIAIIFNETNNNVFE